MHRVGKLNDGTYNFLGFDSASIRLGLDYGITGKLGIGACFPIESDQSQFRRLKTSAFYQIVNRRLSHWNQKSYIMDRLLCDKIVPLMN